MGLFGFGKKKEVLDTNIPGYGNDSNLGLDLSEHKDPLMDLNSGLKLDELQNKDVDSFGNPRPSRQSLPSFENVSTQPQPSNSTDISKDLQIIMAKLDAIRAELNSLHHEVESLKRQQPPQQERKYPW